MMQSADIENAPEVETPVKGGDEDAVRQPSRFLARITQAGLMTLAKRVGYRIFRLSGEFTAIILGLTFFWMCAINVLLAQKTLDISFLKPNAALWFSSAFDGQTADIGDMNLEWHARDNTVTFEASSIVVRDAKARPIQTINRVQSDLALQDVFRAKLDPIAVSINGGQLTFKRSTDGALIAGLGTPETVGKLGPVWRGGSNDRASNADNFKLKQAQFRDVTLFVIDEVDALNLILKNTALAINRDDAFLRFDGEAVLTVIEGGNESPVDLKGEISNDFSDFDVKVNLSNFNPAEFLPATGPLSAGRMLDAQLNFEALIKANADVGLTALSVNASAGEGRLITKDRRDIFRAASVSADYDVDASTLNVTELSIQSEQITASGTARLGNIGAPATGLFSGNMDYAVELKDVRLDLTPTFDAPLEAKTLSAAGRWDRPVNLVTFDAFNADLGAYQFDFTGLFDRDDLGKAENIILNGKINGLMTREDLLSLWPSQYILGARNWIKNSIIKGDLSNFDITLDADADDLALPTLPNEALVMTFDMANTDIRYIRTMTPVTGAIGTGKLEGNRATAQLSHGMVGNIALSNGVVEIPRIYPYGGTLSIAADGEGPVQDLLALIDEKPFEYVSQYGVDPDSFTGQGKIRLSLTRPLREKIAYTDIKYTVTGSLSDVTAPFALGEYSLNNGNVTMLVDSQGLSVKGPVRIGPWDADLAWIETFDAGATPTRYRIEGPLGRDDLDAFGLGFREFIDGNIHLKINAVADGLDISGAEITADLVDADMRLGPYWSKQPGVAAQMTADMSFTKLAGLGLDNVRLEAPGLDLAGSLDLAADFRLRNLDLTKAKVTGFIDAAVQMKPSESRDKFDVLVTGDYLDVSSFVGGMMSGAGGGTLDVPVLLTAALRQLALNEAYVLKDATVLFAHDGIGVSHARLKGVGSGGDVSVNLRTDDKQMQRILKLDIPNASDAAFAFFGLESITGGRLELDATMPVTSIDGPIIGALKVADMQLVNAPIMTRILSLASLQGLGDAMTGEGLKFEAVDVPFSFDGYNLSFRGARASGPALGMTGDGEISFDQKTLDVNGVLVPAYTANSLLGDIPLIGDIFVGKKGEGIFALNYTVRGPFAKSQVAVNPLSALTPGFLRGIFSPQREKLPEQVLEKIEDVRPAPPKAE